MKTSVVMTTYNGERYVVEQMESLRTQSRKIDEVLIFDDCSSDNTVDVVRSYISTHGLSNWSVIVNEHNKGWRLNFLEGVMEATGDVIFYCDQDDIWEDEKVRLISECFENDANVMVCGHDVTLFNEDGQDAFSVLNRAGGGTLEQFDLIGMLKQSCAGHRLAMRRSFRDEIVPTIIKTDGMLFDGGLAAAAAVQRQFYVLHTPLVRHRIHNSYTAKPWTLRSRIRDIDRQIASREVAVDRINIYINCFADRLSAKDMKVISKYVKFLEKRIKYLKERKLFRCIFQTFQYNPINDWRYLCTDILCIATNKWKKA